MTNEQKNISAEYDWLGRVFKRFMEVEKLIPERQEKLYRLVSSEFAGGRTIIDVGCGLGLGSNVLSHNARFVWGVDINPRNVDFAKRAFRRPNMDFEVIDIEMPPTRELAKFDLVVMIETLEHLENADNGLQNLKRFFGQGTIGFITVPNRANDEVIANEEKHGLHLQHFDAGEFYALMTKHFGSVVLYSVDKLEKWDQTETVDGTSTDYLIVAKVESPK